MSEISHGDTDHAHGGHETRDANPRSLATFGVVMFLSLALVSLGMWVMFRYFAGHQELGPPASPFTQERPMPAPDQPLLQVSPHRDLRQLLEQQNRVLHTYAWVDQKAGVVRIPIDRAMHLLLERGIPVRGATPAKSSLGKQGEAGGKPGEDRQPSR